MSIELERSKLDFERTNPGQLNRYMDTLEKMSAIQLTDSVLLDLIMDKNNSATRATRIQKMKRLKSKRGHTSILPKAGTAKVQATSRFYADSLIFEPDADGNIIAVDGPQLGGDNIGDLRGMITLANAIGMKIDMADCEDEGIWER